jgi:hypothetical protein
MSVVNKEDLQRLNSQKYGILLVERSWYDNGIHIAKIRGGKPLEEARAKGRKIEFLYWRLTEPEREATQKDIRKAFPPGDTMVETMLIKQNEDIPNIEEVMEVRHRIMRSAGLIRSK